MGKLRKNKIFVQENATSANRNNDNIKCNNEAEGQKGKPLLKSFIVDLLISAGIACAVLCFIQPTIVHQSSMYPTCHDGDYLLIEKRAYSFSEPERGDIIVFRSKLNVDPSSEKNLLIKRIIAVPGDHIKISDGTVTVNGSKLKESYLKESKYTNGNSDCKIPKGKYFVMGDNREVSIDSRYKEVGLVSKKDIVGKAGLRLWPFSDIGIVR